MKKILTLIAVSVASIALAVADPIIVGHGYFGFGALGTTFEDLDSHSSVFKAFGKNLDFGGGLAVNIPFGGYFGIQPGVDFYVNNAGYAGESSTAVPILGTLATSWEQSYSYLSLDIPVLFTVKLDKWNFAIGPYVSIPLGNVTPSGSYNDTSLDEDPFKTQTPVNFGLTAGVGYEQRLGMGRLVYGARYLLDFLPITADDSNKTNIFTRRALFIDIGYKLPLSFFGL